MVGKVVGAGRIPSAGEGFLYVLNDIGIMHA